MRISVDTKDERVRAVRWILAVVFLSLVPWSISSAQVQQIERDALIALYNSTDGPNWTNSTNWLGPAGTECGWYGVGCSDGHVSSVFLISNGLSGSIPSEFGDLSGLTTIWLYSNSLSGSIPPALGSLANLQDLRLYSNGLSGAVPSQLGSCSSLRILSLSSNDLTGAIPSELGNLANLDTLSLSSNQLNGSIPPELGDLAILERLYLNNNILDGPIPPELGDLVILQDLRLSGNRLNGSIPPELGELADLQILDLDANQLSGSIPPELGDLQNLTNLVLSNNRLTGSIPPELGAMTSLSSLALNRNRLTGSIPPELGGMPALNHLILGFNQLSGSIPPQLGDLPAVERLLIDANQLTGTIPPEIQNLTSLVDGIGIDLRFNALHSTDNGLIAFLDQKQVGGDWQTTQTIAPTNVTVEWVGDHTVWLSWDAVSFDWFAGGFEARFSPTGSGQWQTAGMTDSKTELEIPVTALASGPTYDFAVASFTLPSTFNQNTVTSDLGDPVMATTADLGCPEPEIEVSWDAPVTLSLSTGFDSYLWSTGDTSASIEADPNENLFYWVTVTSPGSCQDSAMLFFKPVVFSDGFERGDVSGWSL